MKRVGVAVLGVLVGAAFVAAFNGLPAGPKKPRAAAARAIATPSSVGSAFLFLLGVAEVQRELSLNPEDHDRLKEYHRTYAAGATAFEEAVRGKAGRALDEAKEARRAEVLQQLRVVLGTKYERFRQVALQMEGPVTALGLDREVRNALGFTDAQAAELKAAVARRAQAGPQDPKAADVAPKSPREKIEASRRKSWEPAFEVLTPAQRKQWEQLTGPPMPFPESLLAGHGPPRGAP